MASYILISIVAIMAILLVSSIVKIESSPPHVALMKFLGRFTGKVKGAGYRLAILRPYIQDYTEIKVETINHDFAKQVVITGDNASSSIMGAITFAPAHDYLGCDGKSLLIPFVNNGQREGVEKILEDIYGSRVREYFQSRHEGPHTWREARESADEGVFAVLRSIVGDTLLGTEDDQMLLKKFERESMVGLPDILKTHLQHGDPATWVPVRTHLATLAQREQQQVLTALDHLKDIVKNVRQGKSRIAVPDLGIVIIRLTFDEITPIGDVAKTAERREVERLEKEAEKEELDHVMARIRELAQEAVSLGVSPEVALKEAKETVQVERSKITLTKTAHTTVVDPTTIKLVGDAIAVLAGMFGGGGNQDSPPGTRRRRS